MIADKCICGSKAADYDERTNGVETVICSRCGIIRQPVDLTERALKEWYQKTYHQETYTHTFVQDTEVAKKRLDKYQIDPGKKLLDVGSGNGAFVIESRIRKIKAYGCEIAENTSKTKWVYNEDIKRVNFPTDFFDVVTMHDVLEHLPDPIADLKEIFRILKQDGLFILDFPNFFGSEGDHHWKPIEHIWYFSDSDLTSILYDIGFEHITVDLDLPSKLIFKSAKPEQNRTVILVPPGIGDSYWSLTKIKSFCEQNDLGLPDVYASTTREDRDRSFDFIQKIPFVNSAGYVIVDNTGPIWKEAYLQDGRTIFKNAALCDYFIAYNGILRHGKSLDLTDTKYETDWFLPLFESLEEKWYGKKMKKDHGNYLVAYFVPHGMYQYWIREFNIDQTISTLKIIAERSGKQIVLIGAKWDKETVFHKQLTTETDFIDLTGQTSLEQAFALIRNSDGVIGYPSGMTIMATAMKKQTLMLWNDYFDNRFFRNACAPQSRDEWYHIINTKDATIDNVSTKFLCMTGSEPLRKRRRIAHNRSKSIKTHTNEHITVACVLRSGGDYDPQYVEKLKNAVQRNLTKKYEFVCLSDIDVPCDRIPLENNWPGWWSKIELFRSGLFSSVIYFDLDTVIVGNIDDLTELRMNHKFAMLHGMKSLHRRASGVMTWNGDYSGIHDKLLSDPKRMYSSNLNPKKRLNPDQDFIHTCLQNDYGIQPAVIQNSIGVASYKNDCAKNGTIKVPDNCPIVCFHGKPRVHEVDCNFVKEHWK